MSDISLGSIPAFIASNRAFPSFQRFFLHNSLFHACHDFQKSRFGDSTLSTTFSRYEHRLSQFTLSVNDRRFRWKSIHSYFLAFLSGMNQIFYPRSIFYRLISCIGFWRNSIVLVERELRNRESSISIEKSREKPSRMPRWQKRIEATAFSNPFSFSGPAWNFFLTLHISEATLNTKLIHYKKCESKCEKYQSKAGSCAYCHCAKRFLVEKIKNYEGKKNISSALIL